MSSRHFSHKQGSSPSHGIEQTVRAHLGLTQQELARLLGVSRTTLAMAEHGSRDLPPAVSVQLLRLWQAIADAPATPETPVPLSSAQRDTLDLRRLAIKREEYPVHQQLKRIQIRLAQARQRQQVEPALRAALPASEVQAHRWLGRLADEADARLRDEGGEPVLLELRLRVLAFERAEIDKLLGEPILDARPKA